MDTVRAYGYERRFALESDEHVNYNNRCAGRRPLAPASGAASCQQGFCFQVKCFIWIR